MYCFDIMSLLSYVFSQPTLLPDKAPKGVFDIGIIIWIEMYCKCKPIACGFMLFAMDEKQPYAFRIGRWMQEKGSTRLMIQPSIMISCSFSVSTEKLSAKHNLPLLVAFVVCAFIFRAPVEILVSSFYSVSSRANKRLSRQAQVRCRNQLLYDVPGW